MKKLMRTGACLLLVVSMTLCFAGCKKDDPDYENVTPPVVAVAHSISGRITSMSGEGIIARSREQPTRMVLSCLRT